MKTSDIDLCRSPVFDLWKEAGRVIDVRIEGISMMPLLRPGDRVSVRLTDGDDLERGDLIAFRQNGKLIVHRFIAKKYLDNFWSVCQKGDNLTGASWIGLDEVLGKVESIRRGTEPLDMTKSPWTWVNRVMGISGGFWVSGVEKARGLKSCIGLDRSFPIAGELVGWLGGGLNMVFGWVVITILGRGKGS